MARDDEALVHQRYLKTDLAAVEAYAQAHGLDRSQALKMLVRLGLEVAGRIDAATQAGEFDRP